MTTNKLYLTRIVTFMGYPDFLSSNPQKILEEGSRVVTLPEKVRYFTVRKVFYDDAMTPIFTLPNLPEQRYSSLEALKENQPYHSPLFDSPILDNNHSLKTWNNE